MNDATYQEHLETFLSKSFTKDQLAGFCIELMKLVDKYIEKEK